jgi:hypothetical protein
MSKRGRSELTGGSGDVNPQEFTAHVIQGGADAAAQVAVQLPIPRLPTKPGRNLVMEFLWITYYWLNPAFPGAGTVGNLIANVTTNGTAPGTQANALLDPKIISVWKRSSATFTAVGVADSGSYFEDDLTDQAGHGILVATDTIFFNVFSILTANANDVGFRVGYRWKDVSLTEYIGIVQSQQ